MSNVNSMRSRGRVLLGGGSLLAICVSLVAGTALAQQAADDSQEIVVVGQRAALERAQAIKENASQIVDSISADDVGKLPDNSVTEALQRVPGVVIEHFATPSAGVDTNHYQNEGTGLMVRGLPNVAGWLNGREAFSANGSRSLSWEDVPPELMSAVNVYKSPSADMMQGGFGGAVDLRTKLPFDYKELTIAGSAQENYGDIGAKTRPGGSALFADRWMTGIGEVGMVVDVAGSELSEGNDAVTLNNWVPETYNGRTVQVPDGGGWNHTIQTRDRLGVY